MMFAPERLGSVSVRSKLSYAIRATISINSILSFCFYVALVGVIEYRRIFDGAMRSAIPKAMLVVRLMANHINWWKGLMAFYQAFIFRHPKRLALAIDDLRLLSYCQVAWDFMSHNHKKRAQNKPLVRHTARSLNLDSHTIQVAHDATWIENK